LEAWPEGGCSVRDAETWSVLSGHKHREGAAKDYNTGLNVSLEETKISVVDGTGRILKEENGKRVWRAAEMFFRR